MTEEEREEAEAQAMLADAMRPNDDESNVDFCRRLVEAGRYGAWDDGQGEMLVDTFSASAVVAVHDRLSEAGGGREKLRAMPMLKAISACFRVINKQRA